MGGIINKTARGLKRPGENERACANFVGAGPLHFEIATIRRSGGDPQLAAHFRGSGKVLREIVEGTLGRFIGELRAKGGDLLARFGKPLLSMAQTGGEL